MIRALGWRPSPPDTRDKPAGARLASGPIPDAASVADSVLEVLDQGAASSCVAHGVAQTVRIAHQRSGRFQGRPPLASRRLIYWTARAYENATTDDGGCFVRDAYRALAKVGFCDERFFPYDDHGVLIPPPTESIREAYDQRLMGGSAVYHRILETGAERIPVVKRAIYQGHAVTFGTQVSEAFCGNQLDPVAEPIPSGSIAGGHCMTVVGYDGDKFTIVNSWGTGWGRGGFVDFSADYLAWSETDDLWIVDPPPIYSELLK